MQRKRAEVTAALLHGEVEIHEILSVKRKNDYSCEIAIVTEEVDEVPDFQNLVPVCEPFFLPSTSPLQILFFFFGGVSMTEKTVQMALALLAEKVEEGKLIVYTSRGLTFEKKNK